MNILEDSTMRISTTRHDAHLAPNLVRWGAVFAGVVMALAFFALLNSLWLGIAYGEGPTGDGWVSGNLAWFFGGTAIAALFLAGLLAGYLSGVRGAASGLLNGLTAWGLLFVGSVITIIPGLTAVTTNLGNGFASAAVGAGLGTPGGGVTAESAIWTTFWSLLIGAVAAALGGVIGGAMKRSAKVEDTQVRRHEEVYPTEPAPAVTVTDSAGTRVASPSVPVAADRPADR